MCQKSQNCKNIILTLGMIAALLHKTHTLTNTHTQQFNATTISSFYLGVLPTSHGPSCVRIPSGQVWGRFLLFLCVFFKGGEGASGTICSTVGCNFTHRCTFALKLLLFRPQHPHLPPVPPRAAAMTSPCHGTTAKQTARWLRSC